MSVPRHILALSAVVSILATARYGCITGCGSAEGTIGGDGECNGRCIADPVNHCVNTTCASSLDCPAGLGCLPVIIDDRSAPRPEGTLAGPFDASSGLICRLPTPGDSPLDSLVTGFGASLMTLSPTQPQSGAAFQFSAPSNVVVVSCALFVCTPEVGPVQRGGVAVSEIENFDECVVASATFEQSTGAFDLSSPGLASSKPELDPSAACRPSESPAIPWVVDVLEVGCWGFDDTSVVSASLLVPVSPSIVNIPNLVVATCAGKDTYSCVLPGGAYGTCFGGACLPRCAEPNDCLPPTPTRPSAEAGSSGSGTDLSDDASNMDASGAAEAGDGGSGEGDPDASDAGTPPVCTAVTSWGLGVCVPAVDAGTTGS